MKVNKVVISPSDVWQETGVTEEFTNVLLKAEQVLVERGCEPILARTVLVRHLNLISNGILDNIGEELLAAINSSRMINALSTVFKGDEQEH